MGYEVTSITYAEEQVARASVMDVELASGEKVRVDAFGRDQRDARIAAKVWHRAMYHDPGCRCSAAGSSRWSTSASRSMLAERADVHAARLVRTGMGGADAAVLVTTPPAGTPLGTLAHRARHRRGALAAAWAATRPAAPRRDRARQPRRAARAGDRRRRRRVRRLQRGRRHRRAVLVRPRRRRAPGARARSSSATSGPSPPVVAGLGEGTGGRDHPGGAAGRAPRRPHQGGQAPGQGAQVAPRRARDRHRRRRRPAAQDQATQPGQHRDAARHPAGALLRLPQHGRGRLGIGPERVRERHLGVGAARAGALPAGADGLGDRAPGLRQQEPPRRPHRAHAARLHLPQPHHAERHRRHRAPARLPAQAGRAGRVGRERDGAEHRGRRRDPDGAVPDCCGASPRRRSTPAAAATRRRAPPPCG